MRIITFIFTIYVWIAAIVITIILGILALTLSFVGNGAYIVHKFAQLWGYLITRIAFVRVTVKGKENLALLNNEPCIILSNHQSMFDILLVLGFLPLQYRWFSKKEIFDIPIVGQAMKRAHYIPVDRANPKKALKSLFDAAKQINKGDSVIMFPEGTRSHQRALLPFKMGSFILAKRAKVKLLPIIIDNSYKVTPRRNWKIQRVYPAHVYLFIEKPIDYETYKDMSEQQLADYIKSIFEKRLNEVSSNN